MWSQLVVPRWEWELGGRAVLSGSYVGGSSVSCQDVTSGDVLLFAVCLYWVGLALITY